MKGELLSACTWPLAWAANRYPRADSPSRPAPIDRAIALVTISARDDGVPSRADNASERKRDVIILMKFSMAVSILF